MGRVVVVGASGHAKGALDAIEREGIHTVVGLLDDAKSAGSSFFGYEVLGAVETLDAHTDALEGFFVAIGDGSVRERVVALIRTAHPSLEWITVVHPSASIARGVLLGAGTVVMAGAVVQGDVRIGEGCIVNTRASVDHDCAIGDFVGISPGVAIGGNVEIGAHAFVGVGAAISHGRRIGEHSIVGAGAAVVRDVPPRVVAVGVPARVMHERVPGEPYL